MNNAGQFSLVIGPMGAGKTSFLMREINRYRHIDKNVMVINHACDTRYGRDAIISHDGIEISCVMSTSLLTLLDQEQFAKADVIAIEEVQFFADAPAFCLEATEKHNKHVIAVGLQATRLREPWTTISNLIPIADEVRQLKGLCMVCRNGSSGSFTKRTAAEKLGQNLVGDLRSYTCVCRQHYLQTS